MSAWQRHVRLATSRDGRAAAAHVEFLAARSLQRERRHLPQQHVAAVTAVALAVRKQAPRLGALFLCLAASVALATVYDRYHYAADAIAGALVGVAAYVTSNVFKPRAME